MANVNIDGGRTDGYHHGDLPRALVASAVGLIEEEGREAFTLREVARRVGVSHAAPYRHFADKQALLAAAAAYGFRELGESTGTAFEAERSPGEGFLAVGRAYIRFATQRPTLFRLMFDSGLEDADNALVEAKQGAFDVLLGAVAAAQQAGVIRSLDLVDVAITAWSTVHGLAHLMIDRVVEPRLEAVRPVDDWAIQAVLDVRRGPP